MDTSADPMPTPAKIAIYDLDRTITRAPTWTPFLLHAVTHHAPWRLALLPAVIGAAALRALGLIHRDRLKQVMHRAALGTLTPARAEHIAAGWLARFGPAHIRRGARAQIAADRAHGHRIVIATAAYGFYAEAIARDVGADALIATHTAIDSLGRLLPRIEGDNCYGPAKRDMIERWFADQGIARDRATVRFYSDHVSDVPSFEWADEPVVVNPHAALRRVAAQRGWRQVDWNG
ncbi:HAD superfamily hydrolase (TIGR01490 family) [Sphingomonas insulae]|uniref:HAD-IB family hydrolase n=1 Tax=Sphingomonas insulae TaxID=424800 RepID=A0ABN1HQ46_9SPHN|nr:HAD-IB family hydrolase [Sphingomonas insulae]NIJ31314.1 HAD superfamily hydrolase (TIGR01490 family) [Sphingomonas insulae]